MVLSTVGLPQHGVTNTRCPSPSWRRTLATSVTRFWEGQVSSSSTIGGLSKLAFASWLLAFIAATQSVHGAPRQEAAAAAACHHVQTAAARSAHPHLAIGAVSNAWAARSTAYSACSRAFCVLFGPIGRKLTAPGSTAITTRAGPATSAVSHFAREMRHIAPPSAAGPPYLTYGGAEVRGRPFWHWIFIHQTVLLHVVLLLQVV